MVTRATPSVPPAPPAHLPVGFRVVLAPDVVVADSGRTLVGGSPLTAVRLSHRAAGHVLHGGITVTDDDSAQVADRLLAGNLAQPDLAGLVESPASDVTVVIPVKDRAEQLGRVLAGLEGLACLVVDDASDDSASVEAVARGHGATYVRLDHNVGPAGARNAGLAHVSTPLVAFVDSDVRADTASLLRLTRHLQDPKVAVVGPRVMGTAGDDLRWFERYEQHFSSLDLGAEPASVRAGSAVGWLPSACLVARVEALGPGFAGDLRVGEDVDLVWRLVAAGWRVRYDPGVTVGHDTRATVRSWLGRKAFYGTGSARLAALHGDAVAPAILSPWYAAAAAAILVRRPLLLPVVPVAVAHATRAVSRALPEMPEQVPVAARIAGRGLWWAVRQESSLVVRHWWPAAAAGALVSATVRRAVVSSLVVDSAVHVADALRRGQVPGPSGLLAKRLDDLAYGAGLWRGVVAARSVRALLPRVPGVGRRRRTS